MKQRLHYAFVTEGQPEFYCDIELHDSGRYPDTLQYRLQEAVDKFVRGLGVTTKRNDPKSIRVLCQELRIENGRVIRSTGTTLTAQVPFARMTEEEFVDERSSILSTLPEEFHGYASSTAWDIGHSSGYEEVISCLEDIVDGLSEPIKLYGKRVGAIQ